MARPKLRANAGDLALARSQPCRQVEQSAHHVRNVFRESA
jgi:hypothetical protein